MTPAQKRLVRVTFARVAPNADTAAELFYRRLFELDPSLEALFHGDMQEQGHKLMEMLASAVHTLDEPALLAPTVRALGRRHARYGVTDQHFETVGAALLWTLEQRLGSGFTPEVADAWTSLYGVLATTMKDAMATPDSRVAAAVVDPTCD
jgi:hemoglobin-like flavoprotein